MGSDGGGSVQRRIRCTRTRTASSALKTMRTKRTRTSSGSGMPKAESSTGQDAPGGGQPPLVASGSGGDLEYRWDATRTEDPARVQSPMNGGATSPRVDSPSPAPHREGVGRTRTVDPRWTARNGREPTARRSHREGDSDGPDERGRATESRGKGGGRKWYSSTVRVRASSVPAREPRAGSSHRSRITGPLDAHAGSEPKLWKRPPRSQRSYPFPRGGRPLPAPRSPTTMTDINAYR